jgi:ketosteroid isomerase-like protein
LSDAGESSAEVVRSQFASFRDGLDTMSSFWHADIDWRAVEGAADDVGVIHGEDRLRRYYADWIETFEEIDAEVEEVLFDSPDRCAVVVRNSGRASGSSALIQGRYYVVCTVRDGRIVSGREYETEAEALEAVGSSLGSAPGEPGEESLNG